MNFQFKKATKEKSKLRLAIDGPSGSGKTYTALIAASVMANGGKIAVIDTERGSASLYSDTFDFDVLELDTFSPDVYTQAIGAAEKAGYSAIVIDSLSHAWEGEGGALDLVDKAAARSKGNSYTAWRDVTPLHRRMVDAILQSPAHIIVTMRSKMDYVLEKDERTGKTFPRKVGMAPIQRQGMEYEFTIVADMDIEHTLVVSKSRCSAVSDAVVKLPSGDFFKTILDWLNSGAAPAPAPTTQPEPQHQPEPEKPTNGKALRPYDPETLYAKIEERSKAHGGEHADERVRKVIASTLDAVFEGDKTKRYELCKWLTGEASTKKIPDAYILALCDWLGVTDFNQPPHAQAIPEARAALAEALKAAGQQTLL